MGKHSTTFLIATILLASIVQSPGTVGKIVIDDKRAEAPAVEAPELNPAEALVANALNNLDQGADKIGNHLAAAEAVVAEKADQNADVLVAGADELGEKLDVVNDKVGEEVNKQADALVAGADKLGEKLDAANEDLAKKVDAVIPGGDKAASQNKSPLSGSKKSVKKDAAATAVDTTTCNPDKLAVFVPQNATARFAPTDATDATKKICPDLKKTCCSAENLNTAAEEFKKGMAELRIHKEIVGNFTELIKGIKKEDFIAAFDKAENKSVTKDAFQKNLDQFYSDLSGMEKQVSDLNHARKQYYAGFICEFCDPKLDAMLSIKDDRYFMNYSYKNAPEFNKIIMQTAELVSKFSTMFDVFFPLVPKDHSMDGITEILAAAKADIEKFKTVEGKIKGGSKPAQADIDLYTNLTLPENKLHTCLTSMATLAPFGAIMHVLDVQLKDQLKPNADIFKKIHDAKPQMIATFHDKRKNNSHDREPYNAKDSALGKLLDQMGASLEQDPIKLVYTDENAIDMTSNKLHKDIWSGANVMASFAGLLLLVAWIL